jgi:hypothetical protein
MNILINRAPCLPLLLPRVANRLHQADHGHAAARSVQPRHRSGRRRLQCSADGRGNHSSLASSDLLLGGKLDPEDLKFSRATVVENRRVPLCRELATPSANASRKLPRA